MLTIAERLLNTFNADGLAHRVVRDWLLSRGYYARRSRKTRRWIACRRPSRNPEMEVVEIDPNPLDKPGQT